MNGRLDLRGLTIAEVLLEVAERTGEQGRNFDTSLRFTSEISLKNRI